MQNTREFEDLNRRRETARRRFYAAQPRHVSDVMAQLMQRRGYGRVMENEALAARWAEAVEPRLRPMTRAVRVFRRKLEVLVANSPAMNELSFAKAALLSRLNDTGEGQPIEDIRFRIGDVGSDAGQTNSSSRTRST